MLMKRSLGVDYRIENRKVNPDETVSRKKITLSKRN